MFDVELDADRKNFTQRKRQEVQQQKKAKLAAALRRQGLQKAKPRLLLISYSRKVQLSNQELFYAVALGSAPSLSSRLRCEFHPVTDAHVAPRVLLFVVQGRPANMTPHCSAQPSFATSNVRGMQANKPFTHGRRQFLEPACGFGNDEHG
ncbi:unnamed protein product [Soboliphyme baturini]|uniref:5-formyltetrahydrofolate cyclo-ligase n=1 Tax=Soboliphyme baturini TaxID=241478 RepID=A0A183I8X0_9BILA|nr:unnamed protein product [Soboliphyme baturini]